MSGVLAFGLRCAPSCGFRYETLPDGSPDNFLDIRVALSHPFYERLPALDWFTGAGFHRAKFTRVGQPYQIDRVRVEVTRKARRIFVHDGLPWFIAVHMSRKPARDRLKRPEISRRS
jgi:hypothetical protein